MFSRHPYLRRSFAPVDSPEGRTAHKRYMHYVEKLNARPSAAPALALALARSKQDGPRDYLAPDLDRASWYLPAGTTITVEREIPELRRSATPNIDA